VHNLMCLVCTKLQVFTCIRSRDIIRLGVMIKNRSEIESHIKILTLYMKCIICNSLFLIPLPNLLFSLVISDRIRIRVKTKFQLYNNSWNNDKDIHFTTLLDRMFICFLLGQEGKKNLCQVVFTIRQHPSKTLDKKKSKSLGKWWHKLANARQKRKTRPDRGFFLEISAKQGIILQVIDRIKIRFIAIKIIAEDIMLWEFRGTIRRNKEWTKTFLVTSLSPGLEMTAGQRTKSFQIWYMTGQIRFWKDILTGHFIWWNLVKILCTIPKTAVTQYWSTQ